MSREIEKREKAILEVIFKSGELLVKYQKKAGLKISKKGTTDIVTEADLASEALLVKTIKRYFPEDSILGEEGGETIGKNNYKWLIDPLDGTTNYSQRMPLYGISIGLEDIIKKEIVGGWILLPSLGDLYQATKGKGAKKNRKAIQVSKKSDMIDAVLVTGFPYEKEGRVSEMMKNLGNLLTKTKGIRRTGAASLDLCWTAEGLFDGYWEERLKHWDMAAGSIILEEAGGKITTFEGNKFDSYAPSMVASNGKLHDKILNELK